MSESWHGACGVGRELGPASGLGAKADVTLEACVRLVLPWVHVWSAMLSVRLRQRALAKKVVTTLLVYYRDETRSDVFEKGDLLRTRTGFFSGSFTAAGLPRARVVRHARRSPEESHRKDTRCSSREGRRAQGARSGSPITRLNHTELGV